MKKNHYNGEYFDWQQSIGCLAGRANRFMYQPYVGKDDSVVDFGSGGGFLLKGLVCREKCGIEINPVARDNATKLGVRTVCSIDDIAPESVDVVISSHALEHVHSPLEVLIRLKGLLRPKGRLIIVTPFERGTAWKPNDMNQHLFTWSPMNLGNLVTHAGFLVETSEVILHRFPPGALRLEKFLGESFFDFLCRIWGWVSRSNVQVRVVARRE